MGNIDYNILNNMQSTAVKSDQQYIRIIAGAGSGKTRVLTYRFAHLIENGVYPSKILAITFTNKAAKEMKDRICYMVGNLKNLRISTFHSFCLRFLREDIIKLAPFTRDFRVIDEEDKLIIIKELIANDNISLKDPIVKETVSFISFIKTEDLVPEELREPLLYEEKEKHKLKIKYFYEYEKTLQKLNALDFDDLLLKTKVILTNFIEVRNKWQNRFHDILVDEFQDTNEVQYNLIKLLLSPTTNLFVVGDPDQGIYSFRGAKNEILVEMARDFRNLQTIILEQNYRSTQSILDSSNTLIKNNKNRITKNLFTDQEEGNAPIIKFFDNSDLETTFVISEIKKLLNKGIKGNDIAILYRSHYSSRSMEQKFLLNKVPYQMYGGVRFMERAEIKDVISYLRMILSADDLSFKRTIVAPKRKIGQVKIDNYKSLAEQNGQSIFEYISTKVRDEQFVKTKEGITLDNYVYLINKYKEEFDKAILEDIPELIDDYLNDVGYFDYLEEEYDNADERKDNIKEIYNMFRDYLTNGEEEHSLKDFIEESMILTSSDKEDEDNAVYMMTVHIAKGLEFPYVFIISASQGVFPNKRVLEEDNNIEEERRLFYVAMTRAKQSLTITGNGDYSYQTQGNLIPSVFLKEIGFIYHKRSVSDFYGDKYSSSYLDVEYGKAQFALDVKQANKETNKPRYEQPKMNNDTYNIGDIIEHNKYGIGKVVEMSDTALSIEFNESIGVKKLLKNHPSYHKVTNNFKNGDLVIHEKYGKGVIITSDADKYQIAFSQNFGLRICVADEIKKGE